MRTFVDYGEIDLVPPQDETGFVETPIRVLLSLHRLQ